MRLLASGRDADVFDIGDGRVLSTFLREAADADFERALPAVAEWRKRDPNVTDDERTAIDRLLRPAG